MDQGPSRVPRWLRGEVRQPDCLLRAVCRELRSVSRNPRESP